MKWAVAIAALTCACGPVRKGGAGGDRCWPDGAFRIEALEHGTEWEPVFVVDTAGRVRRPGSDEVRATFSHEPDADVFTMKDAVIRCSPAKVLTVVGQSFTLDYANDDSLTERTVKVSMDATGAIFMGDAAMGGKARFVGPASSRRAGVLLAFLALAI